MKAYEFPARVTPNGRLDVPETLLQHLAKNEVVRVRDGRARELKASLERRGILIRYFDKHGLRDCVRISIGKPEQNDRLLSALRELV